MRLTEEQLAAARSVLGSFGEYEADMIHVHACHLLAEVDALREELAEAKAKNERQREACAGLNKAIETKSNELSEAKRRLGNIRDQYGDRATMRLRGRLYQAIGQCAAIAAQLKAEGRRYEPDGLIDRIRQVLR